MKTKNISRYIKAGLYEALFTLRTNILAIMGLTAFIIVYMPAIVYNMFHSESLAILSSEAKLQIVLPVISAGNILISLLVSIIISASIDRERVYRVFEYLIVNSIYTIDEFLLIKLLSATILGVIIVIPYATLMYAVINMLVSVSPSLLLWLIPSLIFSTVSFTLLMLLVSLILDIKHASLVRSLIIILIFLAMFNIARISQSHKAIIDLSTMISKIANPLYIVSLIVLIISIVLYYVFRGKIVELSLR